MKSVWTLLTLVVFSLPSCVQHPVDERGMASVPVSASPTGPVVVNASAGRALFLKNCAHCHGADAHGDEGPDLHDLEWTDEQIAARIRNGKKGQMTAFAGKFSADDIRAVMSYLRTLK